MRARVLGRLDPISSCMEACSRGTGSHAGLPESTLLQRPETHWRDPHCSYFPISQGSFSASLQAPKRPQPVMHFGPTNRGKSFPQPLCWAARKGRRICSSVSRTQTWEDQAILKQGITMRKASLLPYMLEKKEKRKPENKEGIISAFLQRRAKAASATNFIIFALS